MKSASLNNLHFYVLLCFRLCCEFGMLDEKGIIGSADSDSSFENVNHNLLVFSAVFTVKSPAELFVGGDELEFACLEINHSVGVINLLFNL